MANIRDTFYDVPNDPFATTTDDISEYYRVQSVSKSGSYKDIVVSSAANYPVNTPTRYFIEMPQAVDQTDLSGSRPIVVTDETSSTTLTKVTGTPAANQFRIAPTNSIRRSIIEVHSGQAGNTVSFDYYGIGSVGDALEFNQFSWNETVTKTGDYAIIDTDRIETLQVSTSAVGDVLITLPTVADNKGREIYIYKDNDNGKVTVDGEGAEKIGDLSSEYLFSKWDYIKVQSDGTQWIIKSMYSCITTDWVSRSDWTNVEVGTPDVDYDSSSGTFTSGEAITGSTSSDSGIIHNLSSITFTLRNLTSNGTLFSNNEVITGSISGATALVNEASGTAKNLDNNFYHGTGVSLEKYKNIILYSTSGVDAGSIEIEKGIAFIGGNVQGMNVYNVDTNNFKYQFGNGGFDIVSESGGSTTVTIQDDFYKAVWERKI